MRVIVRPNCVVVRPANVTLIMWGVLPLGIPLHSWVSGDFQPATLLALTFVGVQVSRAQGVLRATGQGLVIGAWPFGLAVNWSDIVEWSARSRRAILWVFPSETLVLRVIRVYSGQVLLSAESPLGFEIVRRTRASVQTEMDRLVAVVRSMDPAWDGSNPVTRHSAGEVDH